jgi:alanyl-tRNA synthetase
VDVEGFEKLMERARQTARSGGAAADATAGLVDLVQRDRLGATHFEGYKHQSLEAAMPLRLYRLNGSIYEPAAAAKAGDHVAIWTARTPFYGESGGQVGDRGTISNPDRAVIDVQDTVRVGDVYFHLGTVRKGEFVAGAQDQLIRLEIDGARRAKIMANHTVTHVLNHKLRAVLGDHVQQKGSLVDDSKTRFDFAHGAALTTDQIEKVETMVDEDVKQNLPVYAQVAPQEQALKVHGLRAVFGEKYPPNVRVVVVGQSPQTLLGDPTNKQWYAYPIEFCGGTHVSATGAIGDFVLVSEEAVGKGVRRLIGVTGEVAREARRFATQVLDETSRGDDPSAALAKLNDAIASGRLPLLAKAKLQQRMAELQKQVKESDKAKAKESAGAAVDWARRIADEAQGSIVVAEYPGSGADGDALRTAMDVIRKKKPDAALLLGAVTGPDKVAFVAAVPPALIQKGLKAGDWVREVAKVAGGGGGGRPDMAQAGGKDPAKLAQALDAGRKFAAAKV